MSTLALRLETEVQRLLPPPKGWTGKRVALGLALVWAFSGVYLVAADQQAVETMFGRVVVPRVMPGLHYALPWPIESVTKLKVRQSQRLSIGGGLADRELGRSPAALAQFLTGDQNMIQIRAVVQYSVGVPVDYLFHAENPAQVIGATVEAELARRVAHRAVDEVLTTEKAAVQEEARAAAQRLLNSYGAGVVLSSINIESATPPAEAAAAFRDVASARADTSRIVNDAQGYANDVIPKARGQARQMLEEAEAYKQTKINQASGDASRFQQMAAEYGKAAAVSGQRLYLETMEQVLPKIKKVIVDKNGNLDLTILRKGDPAK